MFTYTDEKGVVGMPETIRIFVIVTCVILIGALLILYIGSRADAKNNLLHRAWNSFLCAYLKLDIHTSYGADYLKNGRRSTYEEEFTGYRPQGEAGERIRRKKMRLEELQKMEGSPRQAGKKDRYNLKILK